MPNGNLESDCPSKSPETSLGELALLFLRLGATAFGGPAAHIAMMEEEVVRRRAWMSAERFLDLLGAANLVPGPNSTELAIHVGFERAGWRGLLVAGLCFIVPAMLITWACAWAYVAYGALPEVGWLFYGIKPVIVAVVVHALWGLAGKAARTTPLRIAATLVFALSVLGLDELVLLFGTGVLWAMLGPRRAPPDTTSPLTPSAAATPSPDAASESDARQWLPVGLGAGALAGSATLPGIFWVFLKAGAVLFGSGYVLLAFLRADLVEHTGWLTEAQLLDAVAIGQMTPGPVFTTATFIGYLLGGTPGALVATLGIFLPAFVFVAISGPLVPRLRASATAGAFLDGVNAASLALMAAVTLDLGIAAIFDPVTALLALIAAVLLIRFRLGSMPVMALGATVGAVVHWLGA